MSKQEFNSLRNIRLNPAASRRQSAQNGQRETVENANGNDHRPWRTRRVSKVAGSLGLQPVTVNRDDSIPDAELEIAMRVKALHGLTLFEPCTRPSGGLHIFRRDIGWDTFMRILGTRRDILVEGRPWQLG
jgi:hypothetical protein